VRAMSARPSWRRGAQEAVGRHPRQSRRRRAGNAATVSRASCSAPAPYASGGTRHRRSLPASRRRSATARSARRCCIRFQRLMHERVMFGPIWGAGDAARRGAARRAARDRLSPQLYFAGPYRGDPSQGGREIRVTCRWFPDASHVVVDVTEQAEHDELLGRHGWHIGEHRPLFAS